MDKNILIKNKRVLVAMSGGVDSSVAAALLKEQGYEVIGATMQVWDYSSCDIEEGNGTCCSSLDVDDARAVADKLDIPFYVINCESKFKEKVIDPFLAGYLEGQTPLPCVNCNTYLKFDHLIQKMKELDCSFLATGHYAQVVESEGKSYIQTSEDDWKDQTYFLFTINPEIVPHLLFPVGSYKKPQVRELAAKWQLTVAKKKDSQGICFVGNQGYDNFIEQHVEKNILAQKKGLIKRFPVGTIMGEHQGIHHYTYGQSKGIGLNHHEKLFVIKVDASDNTVWVGDEEYLYGEEVKIINTHLLSNLDESKEYSVKIRYQHKGALAKIIKLGASEYKIHFKEKQRAITPGQAAVIYDDKKLIGGGWIQI
ncbi:MAG: tRNA 2-thiouridine(34) synthase MnmA [Bdellovibrionaceae bacterium]|nr:tRNA 2-thiouridine(34) synthase MnmA [Pseudobdellovibrionaceae bacterium]NUM58274.1 tRNA 2-thiouridine(34) synthase MnmA [Pseudobdellovibrionaceae bacterium]